MENCSTFEEVSPVEKQIQKRDATFANTISKFDSISFAVESVKEFQEGTFGPPPDGKNVIKLLGVIFHKLYPSRDET